MVWAVWKANCTHGVQFSIEQKKYSREWQFENMRTCLLVRRNKYCEKNTQISFAKEVRIRPVYIPINKRCGQREFLGNTRTNMRNVMGKYSERTSSSAPPFSTRPKTTSAEHARLVGAPEWGLTSVNESIPRLARCAKP